MPALQDVCPTKEQKLAQQGPVTRLAPDLFLTHASELCLVHNDPFCEGDDDEVPTKHAALGIRVDIHVVFHILF